MNHTDIEYLANPDGSRGYAWNLYTGCNHWKTGVCPVGENCWAKSMAHRFHRSFEPILHPEKLLEPLSVKKPSRIGVCFTGDLFGDWVDPDQEVVYENKYGFTQHHLRASIFNTLKQCYQHQFFFLTKNPKGYSAWRHFPDNAYCGVSFCKSGGYTGIYAHMKELDAKHKWLSLEPLLERMPQGVLENIGLYDWCVIGAQSGRHPIMPKIEWVKEIVEACDKTKVKIWLKNNLRPLIVSNLYQCGWAVQGDGNLRQELPVRETKLEDLEDKCPHGESLCSDCGEKCAQRKQECS